jgi:acetyl esterase/lipase
MSTADIYANVDPELAVPLRAWLEVSGGGLGGGSADPAQVLAAARAGMEASAKPHLADPPVREVQVDAPDGPVLVYLINADPRVVRPAILHMHGGGYIAGSARSSVADLQVMAAALDCVIATVEYRLAPETPFPGALEDNHAALVWLHSNAQALGVDPARIAIAGESAGGGHAAMLAIAARDRRQVPICFQALTYPMVDDRTASSRPVPGHIGRLVWTRELNQMGWAALLGGSPGGDGTPAGASPSRVADLAGLPPAFIAVGDIDLFAEEDIAYAGRLVSAGVPVELLVLPGAPHGFYVVAPAASVSRRYSLAHINALARALGRAELAQAPEPAPFAPPPVAVQG